MRGVDGQSEVAAWYDVAGFAMKTSEVFAQRIDVLFCIEYLDLVVVHEPQVIVRSSLLVLPQRQSVRERLRLILFMHGLVDVPVGVVVAQYYHTHIGSNTFNFLCIPEREGIVVAACKQDGIGST